MRSSDIIVPVTGAVTCLSPEPPSGSRMTTGATRFRCRQICSDSSRLSPTIVESSCRRRRCVLGLTPRLHFCTPKKFYWLYAPIIIPCMCGKKHHRQLTSSSTARYVNEYTAGKFITRRLYKGTSTELTKQLQTAV